MRRTARFFFPMASQAISQPALLLAAALLLSATPLAARDRNRGVPVATPAGRPLSCLHVLDVRETRVRDDRTIDFYMRGRGIYRNVLPQSCPQLGFEEAFTYRADNEQLCSVDTITVIHRASPIPGVTCGLGQFQPVTIAGHEAR